MNIMVFNVPAESMGALSVLKEFYSDVLKHEDKNINWIFVLGKASLKKDSNIKVLKFPWVKKSWFHRLYFDYFVAPRLITKNEIDKVFSLQNIIIPNTKIDQILYLHQSLPFVEYKFSFRENKRFWIYQNIIGWKIKKSIKKARNTIVQTKWMRDACIKATGVSAENLSIISPKIYDEVSKCYEADDHTLSTFFYPASGFSYKNHIAIINSCKQLKEKGINNYKVVFTLNRKQNKHTEMLFGEIKKHNLPIEFVGELSRKQVFDFYTKSILLFPSYIETYGLPLLEAKMHCSLIVASNCPFSREILENYQNSYFFDPFNCNELAFLMESILNEKIKHKKVEFNSVAQVNEKKLLSLLDVVIG
ncbi:glycosyltransferase [Paenibacillus sp. GCM10012307]|uniref:Glycosyltransferase n=1 Tax=Paenibacillus roseus TaxID=2798579 RepID=A0A934J7S4_9BACL|nr:glycosyltransferase [Paenibacillus roseus]MBJ6361972.1 glycosyltransferase [Paenibacillus roseus]